MLFSIYRTLTSLSAPVLNRVLHQRRARDKEDRARMQERRGHATLARPAGKVMWIHGASVGESLSVLPLLNTLMARLPDWHFLMTTGTVTSAQLMATRLPENVMHQFIPLDHPKWVRRFMDHWRPDAAIWLESELWPNLLHEIEKRGVPAALVNARMRPDTFAKWQHAKGLAAKMLGAFTLTLVGARDYLVYFKTLGAKNVHYLGSLKLGAKALPVDPDKLYQLKTMIEMRPCIGFLQTHPTEEDLAAEVFHELKKSQPGLLAVVAPRKHTRGQEIKDDLQEKGLNVALRTLGEEITPQTDVYVADTIGEMGLWYTLCPVTVIGGSFVNFGGQNPIEGMHFGAAVLYGPFMFNFPELCAVLEEAGAAIPVASREALLPALQDLYRHPDKLATIKTAAMALAGQNHSVIDAIADEIIIQLVQGQS